MKKINIGLLGFGTIGCGVVKVLQEKKDKLAQIVGTELSLKWVCDINLTRAREVQVDKSLLTVILLGQEIVGAELTEFRITFVIEKQPVAISSTLRLYVPVANPEIFC